tara:strand:- start:6860 stop:7225 length:366 start_codon:yes stop_codon:yes gene_type:complete
MLGLYRYQGRILSLTEGSVNIIGETKISLSTGSTFICAVDPVRDDEHQIEEFGEIKFERYRMHSIALDTDIKTSNKIQILDLNSDDSYNWNSAKFFDVESDIEGDALTRVNEVILTRPVRS